MSHPSRHYAEGFSSRPTGMAWGCVSPTGWVPYPPKVPRRHPLLDSVGRCEDPCDRPKYESPDWSPKPSFKPPREGFPNDMCIPEDYGGDQGIPEGGAVINIGKDTPQSIHFKIPPISMQPTGDSNGPTLDECCENSRSLDAVKEKYNEIVGPLEEREAGHTSKFTKIMSSCQPLLPKYPCRGVIDELPAQTFAPVPPELRCKPLSLQSGEEPGDWRDKQPISGWESIEKSRTCDYYPVSDNLPNRFNQPKWFKGYGCEKLVHPFYVTTMSDYGRFGPNPHTMAQMYYPKSTAFTELQGQTGMYRNRTLNTSNNKSIV